MDAQNRQTLEAEIGRCCQAGDLASAVDLAVRGYGREIFEFLAALHRRHDEAAEVFSMWAEGMWRGMPSFARRCSFRTWAYAVARRASLRFRRDERRRAARLCPLTDSLPAFAVAVRSETAPFLRTEGRNHFARLRASLSPEDQTLLMLRVDRQLAWIELVHVLHDDVPLAPEALAREAARLRKRFQLLKEKLYALGRLEGLVPDP